MRTSTNAKVRSVVDDVFDADNARAPAFTTHRRELSSAIKDYLLTRSALKSGLLDQWPQGDGHAVMVLPGFLAGPASTRPLRQVLSRLGYTPYDWGDGMNVGVRDGMVERILARSEEIAQRHDGKLSLVGWSAGGIYARELARERPELIRNVITLGSPFRGNHHASRSWWLYKLFNWGAEDSPEMSAEARAARAQPLPNTPTSCIYSHNDGIVAWQCCTSLPGKQVENIEVMSSHLGFGNSLETLYVIADRLAQPANHWRPYHKSDRATRHVAA